MDKTKKSILPPYHKTGESAGENSKSGVTLGLDHIYLLALFELYALHYGSLFWFDMESGCWEEEINDHFSRLEHVYGRVGHVLSCVVRESVGDMRGGHVIWWEN